MEGPALSTGLPRKKSVLAFFSFVGSRAGQTRRRWHAQRRRLYGRKRLGDTSVSTAGDAGGACRKLARCCCGKSYCGAGSTRRRPRCAIAGRNRGRQSGWHGKSSRGRSAVAVLWQPVAAGTTAAASSRETVFRPSRYSLAACWQLETAAGRIGAEG